MTLIRHPPGWLDYLLLVSLAMVFGLSFTLTRVAVHEIPPLTIAGGRLLLACSVSSGFLRQCPAFHLDQLGTDAGRGWTDGYLHGRHAVGNHRAGARFHAR